MSSTLDEFHERVNANVGRRSTRAASLRDSGSDHGAGQARRMNNFTLMLIGAALLYGLVGVVWGLRALGRLIARLAGSSTALRDWSRNGRAETTFGDSVLRSLLAAWLTVREWRTRRKGSAFAEAAGKVGVVLSVAFSVAIMIAFYLVWGLSPAGTDFYLAVPPGQQPSESGAQPITIDVDFSGGLPVSVIILGLCVAGLLLVTVSQIFHWRKVRQLAATIGNDDLARQATVGLRNAITFLLVEVMISVIVQLYVK
ncbi:hypothetical protein ACFY36_39045 [Actinoplanes sp. NPDC000266]